MSKTLKGLSEKTVYHRIYSDLGGVDFSGDGSGVSKNRFAYLENMWRDWGGEGAAVTESIPGFRCLKTFSGAVHGIFLQKTSSAEYLLVHAGTKLYRVPLASKDTQNAYVQVATVANSDSRAFSSGEDFYLLDGTHVTRVTAAGASSVVGDSETYKPYVPTTYKNGVVYEQRNLFSNKFIESTVIGVKSLFADGTPGLSYEIDATASDNCVTLLGRGSATGGVIHVPAYVKIAGEVFRVSKIACHAFSGDSSLTQVVLADGGVTEIGDFAFSSCQNLETFVFADTVKRVGESAFSSDVALETVYLDSAIESLGTAIFAGCSSLEELYYSGSLSEYEAFAENEDYLDSYEINTGYRYAYDYLEIPVYSGAGAITAVTFGTATPTYTARTEGGIVKSVVLRVNKTENVINQEVTVAGTFGSNVQSSGASDFFSRYGATSGVGAIENCTVAETFDGRIFLSGNPNYPGVVFYSARDNTGANNPTYFGMFNYFQDGIGHIGVFDLLSVGSTLAVFKSADDGGSIFYHTAKETDDDLVPKIYPVSFVHTGLCGRGDAISFFDDPVFLSDEGVSALEKSSVTGEPRLAVRSHNVSEKLLSEDLSRAKLAVFSGYLVVSVDGRMYLGDSRQVFTHPTGNREYEWYYLSGIGTYYDDFRVYRYSSTAPAFYELSDTPDEKVTETVYTEVDGGGQTHYFVFHGTAKIAVEPSEEFQYGFFSPATQLLGDGELLFFGTASGSLCVFNTDKRGVPPTRISSANSFNATEYAQAFGRRFHPDFYDFDRHAPRYAVKTVKDDCGIPHLTKDTVKHSTTLKYKTFACGKLCAEVGTEKSGFKTLQTTVESAFSFWDVNFATLSLDGQDYATIPLPEREKRWVEKQISLFCDEFRCPIGISNIAYRYTVGGRIKSL